MQEIEIIIDERDIKINLTEPVNPFLQIRLNKKLSIYKTAKLSGVSHRTISMIERDKEPSPNFTTMKYLCKVYGCSVAELSDMIIKYELDLRAYRDASR